MRFLRILVCLCFFALVGIGELTANQTAVIWTDSGFDKKREEYPSQMRELVSVCKRVAETVPNFQIIKSKGEWEQYFEWTEKWPVGSSWQDLEKVGKELDVDWVIALKIQQNTGIIIELHNTRFEQRYPLNRTVYGWKNEGVSPEMLTTAERMLRDLFYHGLERGNRERWKQELDGKSRVEEWLTCRSGLGPIIKLTHGKEEEFWGEYGPLLTDDVDENIVAPVLAGYLLAMLGDNERALKFLAKATENLDEAYQYWSRREVYPFEQDSGGGYSNIVLFSYIQMGEVELAEKEFQRVWEVHKRRSQWRWDYDENMMFFLEDYVEFLEDQFLEYRQLPMWRELLQHWDPKELPGAKRSIRYLDKAVLSAWRAHKNHNAIGDLTKIVVSEADADRKLRWQALFAIAEPNPKAAFKLEKDYLKSLIWQDFSGDDELAYHTGLRMRDVGFWEQAEAAWSPLIKAYDIDDNRGGDETWDRKAAIQDISGFLCGWYEDRKRWIEYFNMSIWRMNNNFGSVDLKKMSVLAAKTGTQEELSASVEKWLDGGEYGSAIRLGVHLDTRNWKAVEVVLMDIQDDKLSRAVITDWQRKLAEDPAALVRFNELLEKRIETQQSLYHKVSMCWAVGKPEQAMASLREYASSTDISIGDRIRFVRSTRFRQLDHVVPLLQLEKKLRSAAFDEIGESELLRYLKDDQDLFELVYSNRNELAFDLIEYFYKKENFKAMQESALCFVANDLTDYCYQTDLLEKTYNALQLAIFSSGPEFLEDLLKVMPEGPSYALIRDRVHKLIRGKDCPDDRIPWANNIPVNCKPFVCFDRHLSAAYVDGELWTGHSFGFARRDENGRVLEAVFVNAPISYILPEKDNVWAIGAGRTLYRWNRVNSKATMIPLGAKRLGFHHPVLRLQRAGDFILIANKSITLSYHVSKNELRRIEPLGGATAGKAVLSKGLDFSRSCEVGPSAYRLTLARPFRSPYRNHVFNYPIDDLTPVFVRLSESEYLLLGSGAESVPYETGWWRCDSMNESTSFLELSASPVSVVTSILPCNGGVLLLGIGGVAFINDSGQIVDTYRVTDGVLPGRVADAVKVDGRWVLAHNKGGKYQPGLTVVDRKSRRTRVYCGLDGLDYLQDVNKLRLSEDSHLLVSYGANSSSEKFPLSLLNTDTWLVERTDLPPESVKFDRKKVSQLGGRITIGSHTWRYGLAGAVRLPRTKSKSLPSFATDALPRIIE